VPDRVQIAATVRDLIATSWPQRFDLQQLDDLTLLGEGGLGLDSVEIVELVLSCEERFGQTASEALFAGGPLTIARAAEYFSAGG
jgi:acyl carrier protein